MAIQTVAWHLVLVGRVVPESATNFSTTSSHTRAVTVLSRRQPKAVANSSLVAPPDCLRCASIRSLTRGLCGATALAAAWLVLLPTAKRGMSGSRGELRSQRRWLL